MVVVQIEPDFRPMDRSGIASGTRAIAMKIWKGKLPNRPPDDLARELYEAENKGKAEPSGSQDMIGLVYPGVNRLDYDFKVHGGVFPVAHRIVQQSPRSRAGWSKVLHLIPVEPRPDGYSPLGIKNLEPKWVAKPRPVGPGLLRRHRQNGREGARRVVQSEHEMLGDAAAARRPASAAAAGLDAAAQGVSAAISRRDVFRLRRRLSDCGFRKAGARRVPGQCPDRKISKMTENLREY